MTKDSCICWLHPPGEVQDCPCEGLDSGWLVEAVRKASPFAKKVSPGQSPGKGET